MPNFWVANSMMSSLYYDKGKGVNVFYSGKLLLVLASTVILGSGSRGTHDRILCLSLPGVNEKASFDLHVFTYVACAGEKWGAFGVLLGATERKRQLGRPRPQ
jgi:hypothetical protein